MSYDQYQRWHYWEGFAFLDSCLKPMYIWIDPNWKFNDIFGKWDEYLQDDRSKPEDFEEFQFFDSIEDFKQGNVKPLEEILKIIKWVEKRGN